jgi:hypothetical protein
MVKREEGSREMIDSLRQLLWRWSLAVGIVLIWMSVIIVPYGIYLQTLSPNYQEYERHVLTENGNQSLGKDLAPGAGVGLALSSAWQFVGFGCAFVALSITVGVLLLRKIAVGYRTPTLVILGVFIGGCVGGSVLGINSAIDSLQWGYIVLSAGYLMATAGLIFSAIGVLRQQLDKSIH